MDAKDILKKIKAVFDGTQIIPPMVPAPVPQKLAANYPVDGGGPVYVDTTIAVGSPVWSDDAMSLPYPDGTYTVTGTTFSFTVASGVVTTVSGTLDAAAPVLPPAPQIPAGPTIPQFEAMQTEVKALKLENVKLQTMLNKHETILPDLFELVEKLTELPVTEPKALNDRQKEKFEAIEKRENRLAEISKNIKKLKTK